MIGRGMLLVLALLLTGADGPRDAAPSAAFDRIMLRDRSLVQGLVTSVGPGRGGSVEFVVRREWARKTSRGGRTPGSGLPPTRRASLWPSGSSGCVPGGENRVANPADDDPIIKWIDHEQTRLSAPGAAEQSVLLRVRLPKDEVAGLAHGRPPPNDYRSSRGSATFPIPSRCRSTS